MRNFRGLTINGKMVYGDYIHSGDTLHYIVPDDAVFTLGCNGLLLSCIYSVIPETVAQQVGRKDIRDKEAYDGHIISVIAEKHLIDGKYVGCVPFNAKIFWEPNMLAWFYEELKYGEGGHPLANCKFEIISPEVKEKSK